MFSPKKYILFIEKSKLSLFTVTINKDLKSKKLVETDWSYQTLPQLLFKIKKKINKPLSILLSDEFAYVEVISLSKDLKNDRENIQLKAQERIPDNLNNTFWDFKEIPLLNMQNQEKIVQVASLTQIFYQNLRSVLEKINLSIEAIEPISLSFARFIQQNNNPVIIINLSNPNSILMVKSGLVLASENIEKDITFKDLKVFIEFVKNHYLVVPKILYFCGNTKNLNLKNFEKLGLQTEIHNFDPIISLALKPDIKGDDEKVLNLNFSFNTDKNSGNLKATIVVSAIVFLAVALIGFLSLKIAFSK